MENKKNENNNESYLNKREDPVDNAQDSDLKNTEIEPVENMNDNEPKFGGQRKGKSATLFILGGIILLIVIGVAGAYFLLDKKITPEKETPRQIIKASTQKMQEIKTYSYDGTIELEIENKETSENFNFSVEILGKDNIADINNIKSSANLKLVADLDMDGGSQEFSFDLDAKQFGQKKTYLKINDFDLGMLGMMLGPEVNDFKEKWYKLDIEELEKLSASASDDDSSMKMPIYDINKMMALYNKYELLKFQEDLGDVKIGEVDAYHYKVKLDGIALASFYMEVMKEMVAEMDSEDKTIEEEFNKMKEDIEKYDYLINKITDNIDVEIWIGKNDKLIYRTKIYGEFDKEFIEMIGNEMIAKGDLSEEDFDKLNEVEDASIVFYADVRMSDFNQPVEINEPEEAENLVEVLTGMLGGLIGAGMNGGTGIDTDLDGLSDEMETFYGTDPNKSDTDGDGYTDGEEVDNGYDPLAPGTSRLDYEGLL